MMIAQKTIILGEHSVRIKDYKRFTMVLLPENKQDAQMIQDSNHSECNFLYFSFL